MVLALLLTYSPLHTPLLTFHYIRSSLNQHLHIINIATAFWKFGFGPLC